VLAVGAARRYSFKDNGSTPGEAMKQGADNENVAIPAEVDDISTMPLGAATTPNPEGLTPRSRIIAL